MFPIQFPKIYTKFPVNSLHQSLCIHHLRHDFGPKVTWTPMAAVVAYRKPLVEAAICELFSTKILFLSILLGSH